MSKRTAIITVLISIFVIAGSILYWYSSRPTNSKITEAQVVSLARSQFSSLPATAEFATELVSRGNVYCFDQEKLRGDDLFWAVSYNNRGAAIDTVYIGAESGRIVGTCIADLAPTVFKVTLYALEKNGSHIFDGAVIAVIWKDNGKIIDEKVADKDGRVIFTLSPASYRFQPSPLKENRVVGFLDANISNDQELTLRLTEVGPAAFGAPVETCEAKREAINLAVEQTNYCTDTSDCKLFQNGAIGCGKYIHKEFDSSIILQRAGEYAASCFIPAIKCPLARQPICIAGKCSVDYR